MGFPVELPVENQMKHEPKNLTDPYVRGLKPGRTRLLRDERCRTLFVAVTKRAVTWKFRGERRDPAGKDGWISQSATLGPVSDHSVDQARAWAFAVADQAKGGVNPNARATPEPSHGLTLGELWDRYTTALLRQGKGTENYHHYAKFLRRNIGTEKQPRVLWQLPVRDLTRDDVKALHASITECGLKGFPAPTSANRTRECLSAALGYALEERHVTENVAFASRFLRNPENKRTEAVPFELLPYFWQELRDIAPVRAAFHATVLLLGLRLKTAKVLKWEWVDLDAASITIPATAMKMANEVWLPLPRQAVAILRALPRVSPHVFAVRTRDRSRWTHISEEKEDGPLKPYVGGKLRKTYRTAHDKVNTPHAIAEYLHGHVVKGISAHYRDLTQMRDEMRAAQQSVADSLAPAHSTRTP
jgi:integrase